MKVSNIAVMYNACYGGYGFSDLAMKQYNENMLLKDPQFEFVTYDPDIARDDKVMIGICESLGELAHKIHTQVQIKYIPEKFDDCWNIEEYDGSEKVIIDYMKYKVKQTKKILADDEKNNDIKISEITKIMNENE